MFICGDNLLYWLRWESTLERNPLKHSISRRGVHWPLPFSVLGFLTGLLLSTFFLYLVVEVSGLLSKLLMAFWGLIFSHATHGAYHQIREHLYAGSAFTADFRSANATTAATLFVAT